MPVTEQMCVGCGEKHRTHMPDNTTAVPMCRRCWKRGSTSAKGTMVCMLQLAGMVEILNNTVLTGIDGAVSAMVNQRMQARGRDTN